MDFNKMMEDAIAQQKAAFKEALDRALEQQEKLAKEMGSEVTPEDKQEIIDHYTQQAQMQEAMMKQQMEMQSAMMGGIDFGQMQEAAQENMEAYASMFEDDEMSEDELNAFLEAHPVPEEMKKYLMIGATLIGTNDEPYISLALTGDKEDYRDSIESSWGIDGREDALDMLESLLGGRHSVLFQKSYDILRKKGADDYFENDNDPSFDEDDIENFLGAKEILAEFEPLSEEDIDGCKTLYAWDLDRIGLLARILSHVGYITEDEAYDWLQKASKKAGDTFGTWQEYFASLLLGRALHFGLNREPFAVAYDLLTDNSELLKTYDILSLK